MDPSQDMISEYFTLNPLDHVRCADSYSGSDKVVDSIAFTAAWLCFNNDRGYCDIYTNSNVLDSWNNNELLTQ